MKKFIVTGMSCAACSNRVEKAVSKVPGVTSCTVSLLTNSMGVEGTATDSEIIAAVQAAGYDAKIKDKEALSGGTSCGTSCSTIQGSSFNEHEAPNDMLADHETPALKKRLIASLGFLIVLMYFSMGYVMWNWPVPSFFEGNYVALGLLEMLLSGIIMIINQKFFISGFKGLIHRAPNMDTLVALGSAASFIYSTYVLFTMTGDMGIVMSAADTMSVAGSQMAQHAGHTAHDFYFESAAMILTLITVGKMLEARSKGKTTDALKSLMKLAPKTATVIRNGQEITVNVNEVRKGEIFIVKPGENIPVDGMVVEGSSAVNEAALTGESLPVDKAENDAVSAGTLNQVGFLKCEATKVGEDTTLAQIIHMVSDAAATKAPIAKIADTVSGIFVPAVIAIALVTIGGWILAGKSIGFALARGISVLVISCPCALGLATPVAIMVGNGKGAKNGILFKTAVSLEQTGKVAAVALDKTGTITAGEPRVTDILTVQGKSEEQLLRLACALESKSEHPLAKAIMNKTNSQGISPVAISEFQVLPGNGLIGVLEGKRVAGGNWKFISQQIEVADEKVQDINEASLRQRAEKLATMGKTPLFFAEEGRLVGVIAVADVIKGDSAQAVKELQKMGIHVVMLTGDNEGTAKAVGQEAGVDQVIAGVLPDGKEKVIRELKDKYGSVAMVGDGINDAPALTRADIGIAIGAGTDVAVDAADVVLMKSQLTDVSAAVRLSRATLKNIHENLFWAFFYNVIGIPLAAGIYYPLFGWELNPMFAAAAMSLSSFCVVTNALRLNMVKVHDASKDKRCALKIVKEEKNMVKTMNIEGMMCGHCEARVKKALEAVDGVAEAVCDHEKNTAVVTLEKEVSDEVLAKAVTDQDYEVVAIK